MKREVKPDPSDSYPLTLLLARVQQGDAAAAAALDRTIAREVGAILAEGPKQALSRPSVARKAYQRLVNEGSLHAGSRNEFLALASHAMRRALLDTAAYRGAMHPGAGEQDAALGNDLLSLDRVLTEFEQVDPSAAEVFVLRYFGGMTSAETADALGISMAAVERRWEFARTWIAKRMGNAEPPAPSQAVLAHAFETFGSRDKAEHWLHRPNHVFQGKTPQEMLSSDPQAVEVELTRIDHGVYV